MRYLFIFFCIFITSHIIAGEFDAYHKALRREGSEISVEQKKKCRDRAYEVSAKEAVQILLPAAETLDPFIIELLAQKYAVLKQWNHAYRWMMLAAEICHALIGVNSDYQTVYQRAVNFLHKNRPSLAKALAMKPASLREFNKISFTQIDWSNYFENVAAIEPYLDANEINLKKINTMLFSKTAEYFFGGYYQLISSMSPEQPQEMMEIFARSEHALALEISCKYYLQRNEDICLQVIKRYRKLTGNNSNLDKYFYLSLANKNYAAKNYPQYLKNLEAAEKAGSIDAKLKRARALEDGLGARPDHEKAFQLLTECEASEVPVEKMDLLFHKLGTFHLYGQGTPRNYLQAEHYFLKAAALNYTDSLNRLARLYLTGQCQGIEKDPIRALAFGLKSYALGSNEALFFLAENHILFDQERQEVIIKKFNELAAQENALAHYKVLALSIAISRTSDTSIKWEKYKEALGIFNTYFINLPPLEKHIFLFHLMKLITSNQDIFNDDIQALTEQIENLERQFLSSENPMGEAQTLGILAQMSFMRRDFSKAFELAQRATILGFVDNLNIIKTINDSTYKALKEQRKKEKAAKEQQRAEKKVARETKKLLKAQQKVDVFGTTTSCGSERIDHQSWEIVYLNKAVENDYEALINDPTSNLSRLMDDILSGQPWATDGNGKPEILKHNYRGFKGCVSRRINHEDRLVYHVRPGQILILNLKGHY